MREFDSSTKSAEDCRIGESTDHGAPPNTPNYSIRIAEQSDIRRQELRQRALADVAQLMRLEHEPPEAVFGERFTQAFVPAQKLREGSVKICAGCVDDGVEGVDGGPKIGVAGTGVLMTKYLAVNRARRMSANELNAWLMDPRSGDRDFWNFVDNLQSLKMQGYALDTSSHEKCGAVMQFTLRFKEYSGIDLEPERVERAIAKRLHTALGLRGGPRRIGVAHGDARLNRHPDIHERAAARTIDDTGRFRPEQLGLATLMTTGATAPSTSYIKTESDLAADILKGPEGILDPDDVSPIVLVSRNIAASKRKYASIFEGQKILPIRAPD